MLLCDVGLDMFVIAEKKLNAADVQGPYSQHFILFVNYKWAQQARMLHYNTLEMLATDKNASLLVPFIRYIGKEVL